MKYEKERQELIDCALKMEAYGLIKLSGGNVSRRMPGDLVLVTPSALNYHTMTPADIVLVDMSGNIVDGEHRPTSDLQAILHILRNMPDINVVLHTHQPQAVALSLVANELPVISTTMVDEIHGTVAVAPFTISSDKGMGVSAVECAGKSLAVILKHHGAITFGKDIEQALSAAVYLEETCKVYLTARSVTDEIPVLSESQIEAEETPRGFYGQP